MSLAQTFDELGFLKRVDAGLRVWELRTSFLQLGPRATSTDQRYVLQLLLAESPVTQAVVCYSESPIEEGVPGSWVQLASDTWRIPSDVDLDALLQWLYLGNWVIYAAPETVHASVFYAVGTGVSAAAVVKTLERFDMDFIVVSFPDDIEWTIGLRE